MKKQALNNAINLGSVAGKLVAGMLSWKSNADKSDGLATYSLRSPRDGHQLATGNLVSHKLSGPCHA